MGGAKIVKICDNTTSFRIFQDIEPGYQNLYLAETDFLIQENPHFRLVRFGFNPLDTRLIEKNSQHLQFIYPFNKIACMERVCNECGQVLRGRADKKFCDDACRSTYNNRLNSKSSAFMKHVNSVLRRNRSILQDFNPGGKASVSLNKLRKMGFNFDYYTSTFTNKEGKTYYFCYEQGYLRKDDQYCFLVVKKVPDR